MVDALNKAIVKDKTRLILDLDLIGMKKSSINLDLIYKGEPINGDINSALIILASQGLGLFDGKFSISIDSSLATSINPLSIMVLDMLKKKDFAVFKDGIYTLKGELKGGKVVINSKSYTLQELVTVLF